MGIRFLVLFLTLGISLCLFFFSPFSRSSDTSAALQRRLIDWDFFVNRSPVHTVLCAHNIHIIHLAIHVYDDSSEASILSHT